MSEELTNLMTSLLGPIASHVTEDELPQRITPETATKETGLTLLIE